MLLFCALWYGDTTYVCLYEKKKNPGANLQVTRISSCFVKLYSFNKFVVRGAFKFLSISRLLWFAVAKNRKIKVRTDNR